MQEKVTTRQEAEQRVTPEGMLKVSLLALPPSSFCMKGFDIISTSTHKLTRFVHGDSFGCVRMILPQVHLRKPCYDFSFL